MKNIEHAKIFLIFFLIITSIDFYSQNIDLKNASVKKIAEGFQFVEGPLWFEGELLFSDIPANKIYKWNKDRGVEIFLDPSGNSNGLSVNNNGNLIIAQHGKRRVAMLKGD
ncbi:MAG: SMP-30/gluconolactonase/LRE family protein, partial [Melioribacteraceae bacterium]|nr:SMP-30/gluconolactonase/LRE family protein [Melioribacteraceae bacterium]